MPGTLYIVATPIGNLEDITARAVRVLGEVDLVAAEDTRRSRALLAHFGIKAPLFSCHKFNEAKRIEFFVARLLEGQNIALVSDAGTPCISDPGFKIVAAAAAAGVCICPVCGASAVIAALSACGFETSRFAFLGFLPRDKSALDVLAGVFSWGETAVFYESPRRIAATLSLIAEKFPAAQICLCNDISKKFELFYRGSPADVLAELAANPAAEKGEYTCVVNLPGGYAPPAPDAPEISLEARLVDIILQHDCTLRDASRKLHEMQSGLSKKEIYAAMLRLKEVFE